MLNGRPMGFGAFLAPLHNPARNPTLALHRDLDFVERLDRLGFDEVWFGEHHGLGWETSGSPEIMIAAAASRTNRIRLGTGVISLPYHHPLVVADRLVLLDHLTRGRMIFGAGPGAFPSDAKSMGLDYMKNRERMVDALDAIIELLQSDEPVTRCTDWFTLDEARLNLRPFTYPTFEICTVSVVSPAGPRLAGQYGLGVLSLAPNSPAGWDLLRDTWNLVQQRADEFGKTVDRANWRCVGFFHIADTEEQARRDVRFGVVDFCRYFNTIMPMSPIHPPELTRVDDIIDHLNATGFACIGSPDRLQATIGGVVSHTGGFGTYLSFVHEMADYEATLRSHELLAATVMPAFQGSTIRPQAAFDWISQRGSDDTVRGEALFRTVQSAYEQARVQHEEELRRKYAGATPP